MSEFMKAMLVKKVSGKNKTKQNKTKNKTKKAKNKTKQNKKKTPSLKVFDNLAVKHNM